MSASDDPRPLVDLVVARFHEDGAWIADVMRALAPRHRVRLFVYEKGQDAGIDVGAVRGLGEVYVNRLPNVGRESQSYLLHVLRMRHAVRTHALPASRATAFLQGRIDDHLPPLRDLPEPTPAAFVATLLAEALAGPAGHSLLHGTHSHHGAMAAVRRLSFSRWYSVGVGPSGKASFGEWFEAHVAPWPHGRDHLSWWQNGLFAVRTARLLSPGRSDASWIDLVNQVSAHVNPEAGHFMERSWFYVFPREEGGAEGAEAPPWPPVNSTSSGPATCARAASS